VVEVVVGVVGGGITCEHRITCDTSFSLLGVYDCPGIGFGNSSFSVPDFNTRSVQVDPAGGGGTVNDGVLTPSTLMPVSHQKSTSLEPMARADPVNTTAESNPAMRTRTTTTDLVPLDWKCMDMSPFPSPAARIPRSGSRGSAVPATTDFMLQPRLRHLQIHPWTQRVCPGDIVPQNVLTSHRHD
jgi:hypothetical protein